MSSQRLADTTSISHTYIQAFLEGNEKQLPPRPYVRGYIKLIAQTLDTDFDALWLHYTREYDVNQSGSADKLPSNRFAVEHKKKISLFLGGAFVLIIILFIIPQLSDFFGTPSLHIQSPSEETLVVSEDIYSIEGNVGRSSDIVSINGTEVPVLEDGSFEIEVSLSEGVNAFSISATRFLGKSTTLTRTLFLSPQQDTPSPQENEETPLETPIQEDAEELET